MSNLAAKPTTASARDRILDAAEAAFSQDGFAGAGMKAIATGAGVAQGLLHYHFDSKDGLFAAVVARRAAAINAERRERLAAVDFAAPDALRQILDALLRPPLGPSGGGRDFARIFASLLVGGEREARAVTENYDATARAFIDALGRACPQATPLTLSWGYNLALGALSAAVARTDRPERLVGHTGHIADTEEVIGRLVAFCAGGISAAIAAETEALTV